MKTILAIAITLVSVAPAICFFWWYARECRRHDRIMRILDDAKAARESINSAMSEAEVLARYERCEEILEHAESLIKR